MPTTPLTEEQQRFAGGALTYAYGGCSLDERSTGRIKMRRAEHVVRFHQDIHGVTTRRVFYPLTKRGRALIADIHTGTLYDATTGECLASDQMRIVESMPERKGSKRRAPRELAGWTNERMRAEA